MDVDDFQAWYAAHARVDAVLAAAEEEGGPRVSLVPVPISAPAYMTPDSVDADPAGANPADSNRADSGPTDANSADALPLAPGDASAIAFTPEPSRKTGGWSAERQRLFIENLAETGSVHLSSKSAGLSARSVYSLRVRSAAFSAAWDAAQQLAVGRLSALAFDRAIHGRVEQVYHEGNLVGERRVPSERLLMWLLARLDPRRFAAPWERRANDLSDPQAEAQQAFPALLGALTDTHAD